MLEKLVEIFPYFSYISIAISLIGVLILFRSQKPVQRVGCLYLTTILGFEMFGKFYPQLTDKSNLIVLSLSSFIHFAFFAYLYLHQFYQFNLVKLIIILVVGLFPVLSNIELLQEITSFHSYDRAFYSFIIMLFSLSFMYFTITKKITQQKQALFLNYFVLVFFSIDTFLALPANYLVNASPEIVVSFWFIRALALQTYYVVLILYLWKLDKMN